MGIFVSDRTCWTCALIFNLKQLTRIILEIPNSCHGWSYFWQYCWTIGKVLECEVLATNVIRVFVSLGSHYNCFVNYCAG